MYFDTTLGCFRGYMAVVGVRAGMTSDSKPHPPRGSGFFHQLWALLVSSLLFSEQPASEEM